MTDEEKTGSAHQTQSVTGSDQQNVTWTNVARGTGAFLSSPGVKFIIIGFITIALLIPAMTVWALVEERAQRAEHVARTIAKGWGSEQTINGPYVVIPYRISQQVGKNMKVVTRYAISSPEALDAKGNIEVEERKKSIYRTQLYHTKMELTGRFAPAEIDRILGLGGKPLPERAFLAIGVSDMTGFRSDVNLQMNGETGRSFRPGLNGVENRQFNRHVESSSGVHVPLSLKNVEEGFTFGIDLALNGSRHVSFVPAGKTTTLALSSNWPHPGFDGQFLPEKRELSENGFLAQWTIPNLARGIDSMVFSTNLPANNSAMTVNFVEPLRFYQVTSRTLKYSIGFFSLIFLAVFILELRGKQSVHWIQYLLVGLSMVVFYILLLAFAEQVGFALAYLVSSIATTLLVSWYVGDSLGQQRSSIVMGTILSALFLLMYLIMSEEDYALLAGSITAFLAITATMIATRRVNWNNSQRQVAEAA